MRDYYLKNRDFLLKRQKRYNSERKEAIKVYQKEYWKKNHEKVLSYQRKYRKEHPEEHRTSGRNAHRRNRKEVLELMGGKCIRCGFSDIRTLQIDHVNGGGVKEKKKFTAITYLKKVIKSFNEGKNEYQLLCANCNWIKKSERDETNRIK